MNGVALAGLWVQVQSSGGWWDAGVRFFRIDVAMSQDYGAISGKAIRKNRQICCVEKEILDPDNGPTLSAMVSIAWVPLDEAALYAAPVEPCPGASSLYGMGGISMAMRHSMEFSPYKEPKTFAFAESLIPCPRAFH
ncbi:MAG: hypothetical protein MZW92_71355 [Comamonadaceae bacterium]|nr:hypothetical protein [Comamonadaceae bacterium]